ncbi:MAG: hypothetical protein U1D55_15330 [Phycisphaerae bacterium]
MRRVVGIDEAGYGPLIGPLTVGCTSWLVADSFEGDFWQALSDLVARPGKDAGSRLVVGDSKAVFDRQRGVCDLERPVLAFAAACGLPCDGVAALLAALGVEARGETARSPWSERLDRALPVDPLRSGFAGASAALREAMLAGPVRYERLGLRLVTPTHFNQRLTATRNKSAVLVEQVLRLIDTAASMTPALETHVIVDRLGGRAEYRRLLLDAFPDRALQEIEVGPQRSAYRLVGSPADMTVEFVVDADTNHLPVALASMLAKYVRELFMLAFNEYWIDRMPGLRPTAGYYLDAKRFLGDIAPIAAESGLASESYVRMR